MTAEQAHQIRKSFAVIESQAVVAALVFYRRLFELAPELRPMFRRDIEEQSRRLMEMLGLVISLLERPGELAGELDQLGARHVGYGARVEHYPIVRRALLDMLAEVAGGSFTAETRQAWEELYNFIETAMLRGARACPAMPTASEQVCGRF